MQFYVIKNWDTLFETSETKKYKNLKWVPVPNKHDGKSFGYLRKHKNKVEIFCAWNLILQLASKTPHRGILVDSDNEPLTAEDMAVQTGFPTEIFEMALEYLQSPKNFL